nr:hypothetical protein [Tanacetum cinerariifolium]
MVGDLEDRSVALIVTSSSPLGIISKHLLSFADSFSSFILCLLISSCSSLHHALLEPPSVAFSLPFTNSVKENPKKDKIGSKPDKNGKRGEAGKS